MSENKLVVTSRSPQSGLARQFDLPVASAISRALPSQTLNSTRTELKCSEILLRLVDTRYEGHSATFSRRPTALQ